MKVLLLAILGVVAVSASELVPSIRVISKDVSAETDLMKQLAAASDSNTREDIQVELANKLIDAAIVTAKIIMQENGFDPMKIPDIHEEFSWKPIIITYHGEIDLSKGWLSDASTISRTASVGLSNNGDILNLKVPLAFRDFMLDFQYRIKFMDLGPEGGVDGKCEDIQIYINVAFNKKTMELTLTDFQILKLGKISVKFSGNPLVDWLVNIISGVVTGIFKGLITTVSEQIVRAVIAAIFEIINSGGGLGLLQLV